MVVPTQEGGLNDAMDAENNIIISDSTTRNTFHPKSRICMNGKRLCVVVSVSYTRMMHLSLLICQDRC